jgi:hypothetical protein
MPWALCYKTHSYKYTKEGNFVYSNVVLSALLYLSFRQNVTFPAFFPNKLSEFFINKAL